MRLISLLKPDKLNNRDKLQFSLDLGTWNLGFGLPLSLASGIKLAEGSKICEHKICPFDIWVILSWLLLRNSRHLKSSKNQVQVTLL